MKTGTAKKLFADAMILQGQIRDAHTNDECRRHLVPGIDRLVVCAMLIKLMPPTGDTLENLSMMFGIQQGILHGYMNIMLDVGWVKVLDGIFIPAKGQQE